MGFFNRGGKAAVSPMQDEIKAAVGGSNVGASQINNFYAYNASYQRERAMSVPTVARARDLICTTIGNLPLEMYREMWNGDDMEPVPLAPRSWLRRIDKSVTNNFILSWTADDLMFFGRAFWYCAPEDRTADGYPSNFQRLPANLVQTLDQAGPLWYGPSKQITFMGMPIDSRDVIQFLSPSQSLVSTAARSIEVAIRIEESRLRNAASSLPSGTLKIRGGEPLSSQELADLAASFNHARATNQTAALSQEVDYIESTATPDKMLMIDSADYSARDLSRVLGVPPYLVAVATGSYAYTNSQESRKDLWTWGCLPIATCIAETLSSNNVLPNGTFVKFDVDDFLDVNYMGGDIEEEIETPTPDGQPVSTPMPEMSRR